MTPEQITKARALRNNGYGWTDIGTAVGSTYYNVRRVLDPEWAQKRRDGINSLRRRERGPQKSSSCGQVRGAIEAHNPHFDPRRDGVIEPKTINQALLGDPLPGRSALDRKRATA